MRKQIDIGSWSKIEEALAINSSPDESNASILAPSSSSEANASVQDARQTALPDIKAPEIGLDAIDALIRRLELSAVPPPSEFFNVAASAFTSSSPLTSPRTPVQCPAFWGTSTSNPATISNPPARRPRGGRRNRKRMENRVTREEARELDSSAPRNYGL